jgi:AcrR family transcriptional regulator
MALPRDATPSPDSLIGAARQRFVRGERVDLPGLADELGISRATAYRWAGNAEQIMGEVIAALVEDTFRRVTKEARGRGAVRVLDAIARGMRYVSAFKPLREFLERDPQRGLRIIASKDGPVQQRTIALHQALLEEEMRKGNLRLPVDARTMAYALVRNVETFLYADFIAGEEPDIDKAVEILKLLLRD